MIIFTSSSIRSLNIYRKDLYEYLIKNNFRVKYCNVFKALFLSFINFNKKNVIISSDGKVNILILMFAACPAVIILNGLGRYHNIKIIRDLIIIFIRFKKNKILCVQNYKDFRYFRKFIPSNKISWIPGSGGGKRKISNILSKYLVILRDSKAKLFEQRLKELDIEFEIDIIGLSEKWTRKGANSLGQRNQEEIFVNHNKLLQLYYYGEGVPHSLVDALASKMQILIDKTSYINFGFYKYYKNYITKKNLIFLNPDKNDYQKLIDMTELKTVNRMYVKNILRVYK